MSRAALNISLPQSMKAYVEAQVLARQFSTPSEYIRFLIREDQLRRTHVESATVNPANEAAATP